MAKELKVIILFVILLGFTMGIDQLVPKPDHVMAAQDGGVLVPTPDSDK